VNLVKNASIYLELTSCSFYKSFGSCAAFARLHVGRRGGCDDYIRLQVTKSTIACWQLNATEIGIVQQKISQNLLGLKKKRFNLTTFFLISPKKRSISETANA